MKFETENTQPVISIIMGIYNCQDTLGDAIEAILNQSYKEWELILCDDGSKDETYSVAEHYRNLYPEKIRLIKNDENQGLNYTLNRCLVNAKGEYIARMDGDDICDSRRLEVELNVLKNESDLGFVSCDMQFFDETGIWGEISHPEYPTKEDFVRENPFCHAPCLVRKEAYIKVKGYSESKWLLRVEDYHLWLKLYMAGYKGKNIHEPLYQMRDDKNSYSRRKFRYRINEAYVKLLIVKKFKLPINDGIYVIKPILVGLLPNFVYDYLHKRRLDKLK